MERGVVVMLLIFNLGVINCVESISRNEFPSKPHFVFGSGSSAYQYEGATLEDGRTPSIWDTFAHEGYMNGDTGDIANDGYHKYKKDVQLMEETGLEAYRFSISWSRLIPGGRGSINLKGLEYYNNFINELVQHGIEPHVTLLHLDVPQVLEDEYGGFLSREIVKDFMEYADVCFREFGDRVMKWTTINEANVLAYGGYDQGDCPPRRCSPFIKNCSAGNSATEPYIAAHHFLLAHASAATLYKRNYMKKQHGTIGINLFSFGFSPYTNATEDVVATRRVQDFFLGWFMSPLVFGDYPKIMKKNAGTRLPAFTKLESERVKGSFDFVGLNYYTVVYVQNVRNKSGSSTTDNEHYGTDMDAVWIDDSIDTLQSNLPVETRGLLDTLDYLKQVYGNPPVYIHENGKHSERNETLKDTPRVELLGAYITSLLEALRMGVNLRGYLYWCFLDSIELFGGYEVTYGLYYIGLEDKDLNRYPKLSAHWYSNFLTGRVLNLDIDTEAEPIIQTSHGSFDSSKTSS